MRKKFYASALIESMKEIKSAIEKLSTKQWIEKPWIISCLSTTLGIILGVIATISTDNHVSKRAIRNEAVSMAKVFYTEVGYNRQLFLNALPHLQRMLERMKLERLWINRDVLDINNPFQQSRDVFLPKLGILDEKTRSRIFMFYAQLAFIRDLSTRIERTMADMVNNDPEEQKEYLESLCSRRLQLVEELLIIADEVQAFLIYEYEADTREPEFAKVFDQIRPMISDFIATKKSGDTFDIDRMLKEIGVEGRVAVIVVLLESGRVASTKKIGQWKVIN